LEATQYKNILPINIPSHVRPSEPISPSTTTTAQTVALEFRPFFNPGY
jgi:hypothetical protein